MHRRLFLCAPLLAIAAIVCLGCNDKGATQSHDGRPGHAAPSVEKTYAGDYPMKAVCTTGMVADIVRNVGGERVTVSQIMGEGVDPHLYKASPGDVNMLNGGDVIFYSGLHLEGKMADV